MDRKSKILAAVFTIVVIISVGSAFYRYIILEDIAFYTNEESFQQSLLEE